MSHIKVELLKSENNLKLSLDLVSNKQESYKNIKMQDTGLYKDYHTKISKALIELKVLSKTYNYWKTRVIYLRSQLEKE